MLHRALTQALLDYNRGGTLRSEHVACGLQEKSREGCMVVLDSKKTGDPPILSKTRSLDHLQPVWGGERNCTI